VAKTIGGSPGAAVIDCFGCGITQVTMPVSNVRFGVCVALLWLQVAACSGATDVAADGGAGNVPVSGAAGNWAAGGAPLEAGGSASGAPSSAGTTNTTAGVSGASGSATGNTGGVTSAAGAAGVGNGGSLAGTAGVGNGGAAGSATGTAGAGNAGSTAAGPGAAQDTPTGYGQGTTGGGKTKAVAVATFAAMQAAIDGYSGTGGLTLEYTGKFDFTSIKDPCLLHTLPAQTIQIKNKSEITISGAPGSSANFGFHIAAAASNVILRNMTIGLLPGGSDSDMISIEGMSGGAPKNIWIDHNELFSSLAVCAGAGDTAFDGMLDIKKGGDLITVSYNYLHDHHKVSLNGYTDGDDALRRITFHHNWFEDVGSRVPLQRHGYTHVVNNVFSKVHTSGINVRMGGYALVEANFFENVKNPVTARDSSAVGFWELRNNNLRTAADVAPGNQFGITWDDGDSGTVNATAWTTSATFPGALGYTLAVDSAACVHDGLFAVAGANKGLATLKCK
jgi:pectate lyase